MQSVQERISELEESFTKLCEDTQSDLKSKSVTMWHLKDSFRYLTRGDEGLQDILVQLTGIDDFLTFIKHSWSWLNHELLWKTVRPLCSDELKAEIKQYAEKVTKFYHEVKVKKMMEYFNGLPTLEPPAKFSVLQVKLNYDPFQCTLVSICDIQQNLFALNKVTIGPEFTPFKKCELEDNSLYAVWFMPSHLIPQLENRVCQLGGHVLQEKHILSIVVDEVLLYPAPSEGVTMSTADTHLTKDPNTLTFHACLIKVSQQLSKQDGEKISLKFCLPSTETPRTSLSLLRELEERGVFSRYNIDPLIQLLMDINRDDIVHSCELREYKLKIASGSTISGTITSAIGGVVASSVFSGLLATAGSVSYSSVAPPSLGREETTSNTKRIGKFTKQIQERHMQVDLDNRHLSDDGFQTMLKTLSPRLQILDLSGNQIGDRGAMDLGMHLNKCPNLQTLNLSGNEIGEEGAMYLGMHLNKCPNLQTLNFSGNQIGDRGAMYLCMGLNNCPNLQTLNFSGNQIGEEGAMYLGMGLNNCPNLQTLNFSGNQIGDRGAMYLGMDLNNCRNLQTLNLSDNHIGDFGAMNLGWGLKKFPNLQTLNLSGNNLSDVGSLKANFPSHVKLISMDKSSTCDEYKEKVSGDLEQDLTPKSVTVLDKSKVFKVYLHGYHSLSRVVSHYYQCAENSTHIPFIDPVTVIVCDHQGIEHTLVDHDITLTIPPGAIPKGKVVHIEMGVALYGPFSFPGNTRPISPILWLCPQEDIEFNSPIMVTLPHFLTHGLSQQELTQLGVGFAKADHNNFSGSKESQNVLFNFQPCSVQPQFSYKKQQGFGKLSTKHCCFLCLTANQCPQLARETGFCLTRIDCKSISSTYVVSFYVSFFLPSCLKVLDMLFPDYIDKNHFHFKFSNTDADQEDGYEQCLHLTLQDLPPNTYTTNTMPSEGKIKMSSVDFWHKGYNEKVMRLKHSTGMYPPRVRVNFIPVGNHHQSCKVQVTVTGYTSDDYLNSEISLPLVSCSPSSPSMLNGHGASSFNMPLKFNGTVLTEREHLDINNYIKVLDERDIILLGQALGLFRSNLKKMKTLPDQMIDAWLNQADQVLEKSGPPTWESLCEALKRIDQPGIAATIDQMKGTLMQLPA